VVALDGLAEHVRVMTTESGDFLFKSCASASHQVFIAGVSQFIAMQESSWNAVAGGFNHVDGIGPERRQFALPINNFVIGAYCAHGLVLVPIRQLRNR
jgi:hypothetical protein